MKTFLLSLVLLGSMSAQAESVIVGGFGTDGMSGESIPTANSVKDAKVVYEGLKLPVTADGKKQIVLHEAELKCEKPKMGMTRLSANCQITVRTAPTMAQLSGSALMVREKFAEKIYNAMGPAGTVRMGATTKTLGNIQCTLVMGMRASYTCIFADVVAREFNI